MKKFSMKKESVALQLLLFLSLISTSLNLEAQNNSQFGIDVCRRMSGPPAGTDASCPAPGCFRYYYDFYLVPNNSYIGYFLVDELIISAQLVVDGKILATNPIPDLISEFNTNATNDCYNPLFSGNLLATAEEISFILSNDDNNPSNDPDPPIQIAPFGQETYLFTAVVDAFPGETIDVNVEATWSYQLSFGNPMTTFDECGSTYVPTEVIFPAPATGCSIGLCIEFMPHTGGGEDPAVIPVRLKGVFADYEEIDVLIDVSFDNLVDVPVIIGNDIPASDVEVFLNQSGTYTIYAHSRNVVHTGVLFSIQLEGPSFLSSGATAVLSVDHGRFEPGGGICCSPCLGADKTVVFTGFPDCLEDIIIEVNGDVQTTSQDCANMSVLVTIDWPTPPNFKDFYKFNVVLEFDKDDNIEIMGIVNNNLGCPSSGASYCGGNDCFQIIDDKTIRYCFWTFSTPQSVLNETGFKIILKGESGCINDVIVREAYLSEINGGPGVACVPNFSVDQADFPLCSPMISGSITDELGSEMTGYDVSINGICNYTQTTVCSSNTYAQCVCEENESYSITPSKDGDDLNGVTTFDIVKISQHILGVNILNSPYKLIAADANRSNAVTTFDLVAIRKLILFIEGSFPNNTSWRFVDKSFVFPNPANPFASPFPEIINLNNISGANPNNDFIAIKVGDVNNSANLSNGCFAPPTPVEDRTLATVPFKATIPQKLKAGEVVSVPFIYDSDEVLSAFQSGITFNENSLSFIGPSKGDLEHMTADNFGLTESSMGHIRMLWYTPDVAKWSPKNGDILFYLSFELKQDISNTKGLISFDNSILSNLAFDSEGKESKIVFNMLHEQIHEGDQLLTAMFYPNPFSEVPTIEVSSNEVGKASLWLFNAFGVRVAYREVDLVKGSNTFKLDEAAGIATGVYLWKVKIPSHQISGVSVKQ